MASSRTIKQAHVIVISLLTMYSKKGGSLNDLLANSPSPNHQAKAKSNQSINKDDNGRYMTAYDRDKSNTSLSEHSLDWKPPLRKFLNAQGEVQTVTIRVRIFSGGSEHDFQARFPAGQHTGGIICAAIAQKEQLTASEAKLFGLWVVSRDIG